MAYIFIESPKLYHYLLVKHWKKKGHRIYIFDFDFKARKKRWLRRVLDKGLVHKIAHYVAGNSDIALDNIEKVYNAAFRSSNLKNSMVSILYKDKNIELAYKKALAEQLSNFYAVQIMVKEIAGSGKAILIPDKYCLFKKVLAESEGYLFDLKNLVIPEWAEFINLFCMIKDKLLNFFKFSGITLSCMIFVLYKGLLFFFKKPIKKYDFAIAINNPWFQFKFKGNRDYDFLLDHKNINKSNTLFVCLMNLDKKIKNKLLQRGYNFIEAGPRKVFNINTYPLGVLESLKIAGKFFAYWLRNIFSPFCEKDFFVSCSIRLLVEYLRWSLALSNYRFGSYITFNDENFAHIGRNIILHQHKCKTYFYAHSGSFGYINAKKNSDISRYRHWLWSYLMYDYYIGWNKGTIDYYKLHLQKIDNYKDIGCIWSSFIHNLSESYANDFIRGRNKKHRKIVAFFDTSFMEGISSQYPLVDGIAFYQNILQLLKRLDIFVVIKEKKPQSWYIRRDSFVYSPAYNKYCQVLKELENHKRVFLCGVYADPSEIISLSNLTVTYAFSSPTLEALGAGKKAIFYDPLGKFRESFYSGIPDFVAHGYEELERLVKKLLYEVSDEEYNKYLNTYIKGKVENYLDGRALERFRDLLVKNTARGESNG
jgi:polysaccharide biosynthesis PFTS motif protein